MEFGIVTIDEAEGAILAHSFSLASGRVAKGRLLTARDISRLRDAGVATVTVARLGPDDVPEDTAAYRLADALAGSGIRMEKAVGGRINLIAERYGVLAFERSRMEALNAVHESMTVATLEPFAAVEPGQMVATVKVIPFSVPMKFLGQAESCAGAVALGIAAVVPRDVGLVQTLLPGTADKILNKTSDVMRHRLEGLASRLVRDDRCKHEIDDLANAIKIQINDGVDLVMVVGASAVTDRRDVIPAAIEACSGTVEHFGMPVDPGNLLLLGRIGEVPVVGVPGCARSPKLNGFDWVLQRLVCGLSLSGNDFAAMAVGGLLKEISGRPMPRAAIAGKLPDTGYRLYTLVLAAGDDPGILHSHRGAANITHVVNAAMRSTGNGVYVVTGNREAEVTAALQSCAVSYAHNPSFEKGISTSLRRGLSALPGDADGVVVCLGNSPPPSTAVINALISAFDPKAGSTLCLPMRNRQRGSPMLIGRQFFAELHELEGDIGARYLIDAYPTNVVEVATDHIAVFPATKAEATAS